MKGVGPLRGAFACAVAASLLQGCSDEPDQPTCVPPDLLASCPACGPAAVGAAVHTDDSDRFARLPGKRTAVLGCGKVQYLAPDYSVEREAMVEMTYPAQIAAAGSGDETYVLDVERVHDGPDSSDYLRRKYTVIALEGDGSERWRVVVAPNYDDAVVLEAMPGGVIANLLIDSPKTVDSNGVIDVLPVRRGVLDEAGGFVELTRVSFQEMRVNASLDDGLVRWSKRVLASNPPNPVAGSVSIVAAYGAPQGDTVISGTFKGESLSIDDFVLSGGNPAISSAFMALLDPSGTVRWARLDGTLPYLDVMLSGDQVIVATGSTISVAGESAVTSILEVERSISGLFPSIDGRLAAIAWGGDTRESGVNLFDVALP